MKRFIVALGLIGLLGCTPSIKQDPVLIMSRDRHAEMVKYYTQQYGCIGIGKRSYSGDDILAEGDAETEARLSYTANCGNESVRRLKVDCNYRGQIFQCIAYNVRDVVTR